MTENLPDTNVGNINYISKRDAVDAVEFGITLASAINIETGERTELFQRENDELREAVKRIKDIEPADVVQMRHGRWTHKPNIYGVAYCSECDYELCINNASYCPNCGAKMDGERKE